MSNHRPHRAFGRSLATVVLATALLASARGEEPMVEFVLVRAATAIGLSSSVLTSPTAWREVAKINKVANPNRI